MIEAATFLGIPTNFQNVCKIYPPKIKDVIGDGDALYFLRVFTLSQSDIIDELKSRGAIVGEVPKLTALEFLLNCAYNNEEFKEKAYNAFKFFTHEKAVFLFEQKAILIGELADLQKLESLEGLRLITENNFFDFQNAIRRSLGFPEQKPEPPPDPNEDPRITRMKEKIRERDRIKAKQQAQGKSKDGISVQTSLCAICCMGIGLTPLNIGELSYAAINPLMNMMQEKEKYDMDIRSLLAGASSKKIKPKYWIRNSD